ncbi:MAG: acetylglutamate kinase [Chloroflexota bacterium]|nr:acetylglutamate kinase [Chloroflexota bacterium]
MKNSKKDIVVIKLGGSTLGSHDTTLDDLVTLQSRGQQLVVIHGGGQVTTDWMGRLELPTKFVDGLRVTDAESLRVVAGTLAGFVNKELVAAIHMRGGKAIGLSGVDGGLIQARIKNAEIGYVGEITGINADPLEAVLGIGYIPLIAPLSLEWPAKSDEAGFMLNVNGDTAAGEIAAALNASKLMFLTDVEGVRDGAGNLESDLSASKARSLIDSGVASGGMIPKLEACLRALNTVPVTRIVDGRAAHALIREIEGTNGGTTIK